MYSSTYQTTEAAMSVPMVPAQQMQMPAPGVSKLAMEPAAHSPSLGILMALEHPSRLPRHPTGKPPLQSFNLNTPGQRVNSLVSTGISVIWMALEVD